MQRFYAIGVVMLAIVANSFGGSVAVSAPDVRARAAYAPPAEYPPEALQRRITGSGIFVLRVQLKTGSVTQVIVARSTGNALLDRAAAKALIRWRFKPDSLRPVESRCRRIFPSR